jgi:uncharacterized membrane protein
MLLPRTGIGSSLGVGSPVKCFKCETYSDLLVTIKKITKMKEKNLKSFGRIFYGFGIIGIGVLHFILKGFRPLITPIQPENPESISIIIYIFGLYLITSGILITFGIKLKTTSIVLAYVLILFLLFGHLPKRIIDHPEILANWTNTLKLATLIGGAFLISMGNPENTSNNLISKLVKLAPFGKYFFCVMLIAFGIDHFLYVEFVNGLVPKWIPFPIFWTYFTGVALIGSGISILINFKIKVVFQLVAIMFFIWLLTIHIPFAIRFPHWNDGENIIGSFQCLAFTGVALILAFENVTASRAILPSRIMQDSKR